MSDGASMAILVREVGELYAAAVEGRPALLPELPVQYADFAVWQRERLAGERLAEEVAWWRERLAGAPPTLDLPADHPRPARPSLAGTDVRFAVGRAVAEKARELARETGATPFVVALAAFLAVLQRWTGEGDLSAGTAVAGRDRAEVAGLIGFFVNTVVLRGDLSGDPPFRELLGRLRETVLGAFAHQDLPFEKLVEELQPARDASRPPLVQVMLVLQSTSWPRLPAGGLEIEPVRFPAETAKLDLTLTLDDGTDDWVGSVQAATDLFERVTVQRFTGHLRAFLAAAVADPGRRLSDLPMLSEPERHQLTVEEARSAGPAGASETLVDLFLAAVRQAPEAPAVTGGGETWTYADLDRRSRELAADLVARGAGPEVPVALCFDRTPEMVVAILGVLRAGAAYVPLGPAHPAERRDWILADSGARLLLTPSEPEGGGALSRVAGEGWGGGPESLAYVLYTSGSTGRPKGVGVTHRNVVRLLRQTESWLQPGPADVWTLFHSFAFDFSVWEMWGALAYGGRLVVVPHAVTRSPADFHALLVREGVTVLNQTPSAFGQLLAAAPSPPVCLRWLIFGGEALDPRQLLPWMAAKDLRFANLYGITETTVHVTVQLWQLTGAEPRFTSEEPRLTRAEPRVPGVEPRLPGVEPQLTRAGLQLPGAEPRTMDEESRFTIAKPHFAREGTQLPSAESQLAGAGLQLTNTEPQLTGTESRPRGAELQLPCKEPRFTGAMTRVAGAESLIGRPIPDVTVHLLDRFGAAVPLGVPGELHVGGAGLARGYVHRPDLTADRFRPDPFSGPGARLYRSGDLARRRHDGSLAYLGRIDHQVKIRGFRIELGEVEAALRSHPAIQDVAVLLDGEGESRRLLAFFSSSRPPDPAALRDFLLGRLPEPMVPAAYLPLDRLPVTANGKVDRAALARRAGEAARPQAEYVPPRGPVQELLAGLWAELLGVERVGASDRFFDLGGHSLLAVQLVSRVRDRLGVELPLQAVFEAPSLAGLAQEIEAEAAALLPPLRPMQRLPGEPLPLSFAQERMWFLQQLDPESTVYNMPLALRLEGDLRMDLLDAALRALIDRQEALRTRFPVHRGEPAQVVGEVPLRAIAVVDLQGLPGDVASAELDRLASFAGAGAVQPFDLAVAPPLRSALVLAERTVLLLDQHHIISDGWSLALSVRELVAFYAAFLERRAPALPPLPLQYADHAAWQRAALQGETLERELAFWRKRLADVPHLGLPTDRPRTSAPTVRGGTRTFRLAPELLPRIEVFGRREGATLFMVVLAAFYALLGRSTGQDDLSLGTVTANRDRSEIEGLIGLFVNTLVLRASLAGDPTFREALARTRRTTLEAFSRPAVPFEKLVAELRPGRDLSRTPLFQVMLVLQNTPAISLAAPGLRITPLETPRHRPVQIELSWSLREEDGILAATLEYARDLFDDSTVERMAGHFERLLAGALDDPGRRISELPMLSAAELDQVLWDWSGVRRLSSSSQPLLLHALIEDQVARSPDAPAIEAGGVRTSYAELDRRGNVLARRLRRLGVGPEARVGLAAERSPEALMAMLAVLKAGGTYVPLDPTYPEERLRWMAADAGLAVLLVQPGHEERFPISPPGGTLLLGETLFQPDSDASAEPDRDALDPRNAAYVLYTSGSTGAPKGVTVEHRSIAAYTLEAREAYGIRAGERVLQFASLSFDTSAEEIFPSLAAGACLVLRPEGMAGAARSFLREVERLEIGFLDLPTAYWHELVLGIEAEGLPLPACVREVVVGGEEARAERVADWRRRFGRAVPLVNGYGPTEVTIVATRADLTGGADDSVPDPVPIGSPIAGCYTYVIGASRDPVPPGVPGELWVGGTGVARGYRNRPGLTAERFVPDAWSGSPGARLYRTGDRVRWRPDGALEYLGRVDSQVKVRGYRVEPGEVEAALERHPDVGVAVVVPWASSGSPAGLAAYAVPARPDLALEAEALRRFLAERLPPPLVPAWITVLPALPLTPTGKVDRKRLPAPERQTGGAFAPPRSETERIVAEVWSEALGVNPVGVHDNLFDLGGHSLLLPRIQARLRERLERDLPLLKLFEHPTVASLAADLDRSEAGTKVEGDSRGRALRQRQGLAAQRRRLSGRPDQLD
ncbi:MAG TPA: amino acid adenylation domain-containing protein [Thermoanaerobaculia bacterium]|nr:amino acid adenylation domain-containing protein [Thermoanaerobaculia bacterium]